MSSAAVSAGHRAANRQTGSSQHDSGAPASPAPFESRDRPPADQAV